jgi:anti-sigma regulatory factor (Ser/Thr protein kinase)
MDKIEIFQLYNITEKEKYIKKFIKNNKISIEFIYLSDFVHTKILRDYIRIVCDLMGLNKKETLRIVLITDEMNNNAIEY